MTIFTNSPLSIKKVAACEAGKRIVAEDINLDLQAEADRIIEDNRRLSKDKNQSSA